MKILLRLVVILFGVLGLTFLALLLLPGERIARVAEAQFEAAFGRSLSIEGEIRPALYPSLGVRTGEISVANADWATAGPMLRADGLAIGVALAPLLRGEIVIDEILLERPVLNLARAEDGRANWTLSGAPQAAPAPAAVSGPAELSDTDAGSDPVSAVAQRGITLVEARVQEGSVRYEDAATGTTHVLSDLNLAMALPDGGARGALDLSGLANGVEFLGQMTVERPLDALGGEPVDVALDATAAGASLRFEGLASPVEGSVQGRFTARAPDATGSLRQLGVPSEGIPDSFLADALLTGQATLTSDGTLYVRDGTLRAGPNEVRLSVDLIPGEERPLLRAALSGGRLDLSALSSTAVPPAATGGTPAPGTVPVTSGSSAALASPIDVSFLELLDAEMRLDLAGADLGEIILDRIDARLRLDRARFVADLRTVNLFGGRLTGEAVVNGRDGLSLGGDLTLEDLELQPALTALADHDRLIAPLDVSLQYLAAGDTLDDLLGSLSGSGRIGLGEGALLGLDLWGMVRNRDMAYRGEGLRTVFDSIDAGFRIENGVLSAPDIRFATPFTDGDGEARVDLPAETVEAVLRPTVTRNGAAFIVPILIIGPWLSPDIRPDFRALAEQALQGAGAELEDEVKTRLSEEEDAAKAEVFEKLGEELEAPIETTADFEDALKDKAREELSRGLLKLFE